MTKFDPNFVATIKLILEEDEFFKSHLFISEQHIMQCNNNTTGIEEFRFVVDV